MSKLDQLFDSFCKITGQPEEFLSPRETHTESIKNLLKNVYDFTKDEEVKPRRSAALPELIIENFDIEQIWQQQELQNEGFLTKMLVDVSKFVVNKKKLVFEELQGGEELNEDDAIILEENEANTELIPDPNQSTSDEEQSGSEKLDFSDTNEDLSEQEDEKGNIKHKKSKKSIVDDDFFKLDEMEEFLKAGDKKYEGENDKDSGNDSESEDDGNINNKEIDYFKTDIEPDDNVDERLINPRFKDFFRRNDEPRNFDRRRNKFDQEDDDEENASSVDNEEGGNEKTKSTFELREERLNNKIQEIEQTALSEKPWPMLGEISAEKRPINSLLEEVVEFDIASRPAPVITEKTTLQLDDIIKQRIKDKAFDSVERKEKPVEAPLEYKKKLVLDQEKSKESLAQIYEKEYLQQQEALNPNNGEEKEEEEPELHKEVKKMMDSLFGKLDALSNYHFTPKPAIPELKIVNNIPAINMEEVAPIATSDAKLLAPEEVKNRIKGDIIGKNERSTTDKNRERRKKKRKQHVHALIKQKKEAMLNKLNPGLGNKYSKEKAKKQLEKIVKDKNVDKMDESYGSKAVKSSTAFFTQLQDEARSQIKGKLDIKKRKKSQAAFNAKKMKL